jgi:CRISPR-associated protein Cas2
MSARNVYLVAYDVRDPKRLRRVHKTMTGYGDALQFSVFQCRLTAAEKQKMIGDISEIIHHKEDRILIVDMGPQEGRGTKSMEVLGLQEVPQKGGPVVL